jgi:hypothetical protein
MDKSLKKLFLGILFLAVFLLGVDKVGAAAGCCSWHGGVSYCDSSVGKQVCNDGSYSPSCTCAKDQEKKNETISQQAQQLSDKKWCGAGAVFENEDDAKKSLTEYTEKAKEPLKNDIARLDQEKKNNKITLYVLLAIVIALVTYASFKKEQVSGVVVYSKKHRIVRIIILVALAFFIFVLIYYFSYFLPKKESIDSQQWKTLEQARLEENNKQIDSWIEQQRLENEQKQTVEDQQKEEQAKKQEEDNLKKEQTEKQKQLCLENAQKIYEEKRKIKCDMLLSDYKDCVANEYSSKSVCSSLYGTHYDNKECDLPYSKQSELNTILNDEKKKCN